MSNDVGPVKGISYQVDAAIALVADGHTQAEACKLVGMTPQHLSRKLNTDQGQQRLNHHLGQRLRAVAPKAIAALENAFEGKNGVAKVRAAEALLDRAGMTAEKGREACAAMQVGDIRVMIDLS